MIYTQATIPENRSLVQHLVYSLRHKRDIKSAKVPFLEIFSCTNLKTLSLDLKGQAMQENDLEQLEQLQALESLSISNSKTIRIPASIADLPNLHTLELHNFSTKMYCREMGTLKTIKRLSLQSSKLEELPRFVSKLSQLEELDLSLNKLTAYYIANLNQLKQLKILNLSSNKINWLDFGLVALTALKELDIRDNPIEVLPAIFPKTTIVKGLTELPPLKKLNQAFCKDNYSLDTINLKGLKVLSLKGGNLTKIPDFVFELTELEELNLHRNKLGKISPKIQQFKKLKRLNLSRNNLKKIPIEIGNLPLLETLELGFNELTFVPDFFATFSNLKELHLQHNKLSVCPKSIRHCPQLEKFYWINNRFHIFPVELLYLNLDINPMDYWKGGEERGQITELVTFLKNLKKVETTDLQKEQFVAIYAQKSIALKQLSKDELLTLLPLTQKTLHHQIRTLLQERDQENLALNPIQKGSILSVQGKTSRTKSAINTELTKYDVQYASKFNATVTHLVLGENIKKVDHLLNSSVILISEQNLQDYLHEMDTPYLLEQDSGLDTTHISSLLLSLDIDNVSLGLELLKGGGVPKNLLTELFIVYKLSEDKVLQKQAKAFLTLNASPVLQNVLKSRKKLKDAYDRIPEFTKDTELEVWKITQYAYKIVRQPRHWPDLLSLSILKAPQEKANEFADYAIKKELGTSQSFYLNQDMVVLLDYLYAHTEIQKMDVTDVLTLPNGISSLVNMKSFQLRSDDIKALPDDFGQLQLETITLGKLYFTNWNKELKKLVSIQSLKEVTLSLETADACDALADLKQIASLKIEICTRDYRPYQDRNTYMPFFIKEHISQLTQLKELFIVADLGKIPIPFCTKLLALEKLSIRSGKTEEELIIPNELGNWVQLKELSIEYCFLKNGIPDVFQTLQNLEQLTLSYIEGELPKSLSNLPQLTYLSIQGTFTFLPSWFQNYMKLEELHIRKAAIANLQTFAQELSKMSSLKKIILSRSHTFDDEFDIKQLQEILPGKEIIHYY